MPTVLCDVRIFWLKQEEFMSIKKHDISSMVYQTDQEYIKSYFSENNQSANLLLARTPKQSN